MSLILLPTCNTHARVAEISATLLARYWPEHPAVHVLHYEVRPRIVGATLHAMGKQEQMPWLRTMVRFLGTRSEEIFLLLLDDYALCGRPRVELIGDAMELMRRDPAVGFFPLCWYPAAGREARAGWPGIVTLHAAPILLQAALWRREWFLELAAGMDDRSSPWGFEAEATRIARLSPREICAAEMAAPALAGGNLIDGFDKADWPLPYHNLMHRGLPDERHEEFLRREGLEIPSRGLGDTIAKLARVTRADRVVRAVERVTGRECGCAQRRRRLNERVPYR